LRLFVGSVNARRNHDNKSYVVRSKEEKMSKLTRIATPLIAVAMMTAPMMMTAQSSQQGTQNSTTSDWQTPPAGTEQADAYRDGIEAAKLDTVANRKVDPKASYLYNHPKAKGADKEAYRNSFSQGYNAAVAHGAAGKGGM
jgi:hypothetical protein